MEKLNEQIINFGPSPLVQGNRKKRLLRYFIILIWLVILLISALAMRVQFYPQSGVKGLKEEKLLEVLDSEGKFQNVKEGERFDELLGAKVLNQAEPIVEPNGNPAEAGSVEELLEGKEIIIP